MSATGPNLAQSVPLAWHELLFPKQPLFPSQHGAVHAACMHPIRTALSTVYALLHHARGGAADPVRDTEQRAPCTGPFCRVIMMDHR